MELEDRLTKVKIFLITTKVWSWFGQLSCYLNFLETSGIDTAMVDLNGNVYYNKKWLDSLDDLQLRSVVCHEVLHIAFRHIERLKKMETRNAKIWNIACDLKVNEELKNKQDISLIKGCLVPDYRDNCKINLGGKQIAISDISEKTSEQIYFELKKQLPPQFIYSCDLIMPAMSKQEEEELKKKGFNPVSADSVSRLGKNWQGRVYSASQQSRGNTPAGVMREIYKLENSELPWDQILRQRFKRMAVIHSWNKPSKRYFPKFYFPGRVKAQGIKIVAAFDTSGSMSKEQITKAVSELYGLATSFTFIELWVMDCDAEVYEAKKLKPSQLSSMILKGGGGTDFCPVFNWVKKELKDRIDSLVFFTDMNGNFPVNKPTYETFWVTDSAKTQAPFGRKLLLKSED